MAEDPGRGRRPPLRVAIPKPAVAAGADGLDLVASGTLVAALRALLILDRVTAIEPPQIGDVAGSPAEIARAVSADEVLTLTAEPSGPAAIARRRSPSTGRLWRAWAASSIPRSAVRCTSRRRISTFC